MEKINYIDLIGSSDISLGDAVDNTVARSSQFSHKKHLEVVEAFTSTHGNKSNYKIKLKLAKQESVKYV